MLSDLLARHQRAACSQGLNLLVLSNKAEVVVTKIASDPLPVAWPQVEPLFHLGWHLTMSLCNTGRRLARQTWPATHCCRFEL